MNQSFNKESAPSLRCSQCEGTSFESTPVVLPSAVSPVLRTRVNFGVKGYVCLNCSHIELFMYTNNELRKAYKFWILYLIIATLALTAFVLYL